MKHRIKKFKHLPGCHCASTAFRDVFVYFGYRFSEEMLFGISGPLYFVYWWEKGEKFPFVTGRTKDVESSLCQHLNIKMQAHEAANKAKAYRILKNFIARDIPVILNADMPPLSYLKLPRDAHFGYHFIVVCGLDEEKGVAYVADTHFKKIEKITLKNLAEARASRHKLLPPKNRWYTFKFPKKLPPMDQMIKKSIRKVCHQMLFSRSKNFGLKGIKYAGDQMLMWEEKIDPKIWTIAMWTLANYIEEFGTGGANFRNLWVRYLRQAARYFKGLEREKLLSAASQYKQAAFIWMKISEILRSAAYDKTKLHQARSKMYEVAGLEEAILTELQKF